MGQVTRQTSWRRKPWAEPKAEGWRKWMRCSSTASCTHKVAHTPSNQGTNKAAWGQGCLEEALAGVECPRLQHQPGGLEEKVERGLEFTLSASVPNRAGIRSLL